MNYPFFFITPVILPSLKFFAYTFLNILIITNSLAKEDRHDPNVYGGRGSSASSSNMNFHVSSSSVADIKSDKTMQDRKTSVYKIIVADDELTNRKLLSKKLEMLLGKKKINFKIDLAANGLELLEKVIHNEYDMIITDFSMPELNGPSSLLEMAKKGKNSKAVIVTYTLEGEKAIEAFKEDYRKENEKNRCGTSLILELPKQYQINTLQAIVDKAIAWPLMKESSFH